MQPIYFIRAEQNVCNIDDADERSACHYIRRSMQSMLRTTIIDKQRSIRCAASDSAIVDCSTVNVDECALIDELMLIANVNSFNLLSNTQHENDRQSSMIQSKYAYFDRFANVYNRELNNERRRRNC